MKMLLHIDVVKSQKQNITSLWEVVQYFLVSGQLAKIQYNKDSIDDSVQDLKNKPPFRNPEWCIKSSTLT